jgi:hypothetical protein
MGSLRVKLGGLLAALAPLLSGGTALAAEPVVGSADAASEARVPAGETTSLDVHSDSPDVGVEALREAIAAELGVEVALQGSERAATASSRVTVTYRAVSRELAVSVTNAKNGTVTRVVEAPAQPSEVVATAALLVGNLARDQVAAPPLPAPAPVAAAPAELETPRRPREVSYVQRPVETPPERFGNASFFYPVATNMDAPKLRTHVSFNALYGRVGAVDGLELGVFNSVSDRLSGLQVGLLGNWVGGSVSAIQLGTAFNVAGSLEGLQASFGVNRARDASTGAQLAMVANVNSGNLDGLQIAPLNRASNVRGAQLGLINIGAKVSGLQLGLVNIADDVDGVPLGLVSVTRSGGVHPMLWGSTASLGNVAVKFATRYTYTFLSFAIHRKDEHTQLGPGLGIGFSVPIVDKRFYFEPDLSAQHLFGDTECCEKQVFGAIERRRDQSQFKVRAALRVQAAKHLSFFAGGGAVGSLRYPLDAKNNTQYRYGTYLEAFGGVQL